MASREAHASPTKGFFIDMVTRDIGLEDCVLDLLDNSVDGAGKTLARDGRSSQTEAAYSDFHVNIDISPTHFRICDNCGGISISEAIDYAFHFGRREDAPRIDDFSIGLYGIGMKRAIFKIGKKIDICSSTREEAFLVNIDVPAWRHLPDHWEFDLEDTEVADEAGTSVSIVDLNPSVADAFGDPVFANGLRRMIARDYSFFLMKGLRIILNEQAVRPYEFSVKESDTFLPAYIRYSDPVGVDVEIKAGMAGLPPDDDQEDTPLAETEYYGWFVLCNDRVVLASNKTEDTVWGQESFQVWHPQYNGFIGIVSFYCKDPRLLPWTTTKRDVDQGNQVYRRAIPKMKEVTQPWIEYTRARKEDRERARQLEQAATSRPIRQLDLRPRLVVPQITSKAPRVKVANINYSKPKVEVEKVAEALGDRFMPYRTVGIRTFEYFVEKEVDDNEDGSN